MISATELLILLNASDRSDLDSLVSLIERGMVEPVTDIDAIVAVRATAKGDAAMELRTLPLTTE